MVISRFLCISFPFDSRQPLRRRLGLVTSHRGSSFWLTSCHIKTFQLWILLPNYLRLVSLRHSFAILLFPIVQFTARARPPSRHLRLPWWSACLLCCLLVDSAGFLLVPVCCRFRRSTINQRSFSGIPHVELLLGAHCFYFRNCLSDFCPGNRLLINWFFFSLICRLVHGNLLWLTLGVLKLSTAGNGFFELYFGVWRGWVGQERVIERGRPTLKLFALAYLASS